MCFFNYLVGSYAHATVPHFLILSTVVNAIYCPVRDGSREFYLRCDWKNRSTWALISVHLEAKNLLYLLASNGNIFYYHGNNGRVFIVSLSNLGYLNFSER